MRGVDRSQLWSEVQNCSVLCYVYDSVVHGEKMIIYDILLILQYQVSTTVMT